MNAKQLTEQSLRPGWDESMEILGQITSAARLLKRPEHQTSWDLRIRYDNALHAWAVTMCDYNDPLQEFPRCSSRAVFLSEAIYQAVRQVERFEASLRGEGKDAVEVKRDAS